MTDGQQGLRLLLFTGAAGSLGEVGSAHVRPCFVSRLAKTHGYCLRRLSRTNKNVLAPSFTVPAFGARVLSLFCLCVSQRLTND